MTAQSLRTKIGLADEPIINWRRATVFAKASKQSCANEIDAMRKALAGYFLANRLAAFASSLARISSARIAAKSRP